MNYTYNVPKTVYPKVGRIIAIGDIHGDWNVLKRCLRMTGLVNKKLDWTGGKTHLVQVGDLFDRGGRSSTIGDEMSEWRILKLLIKLQEQSKKNGGNVHLILGNHELMNIEGDFRYTTPLSIKDFNNRRKDMLRPGGDIAKVLAISANSVVKIGGWLFSHAGVRSDVIAKYSLKDINNLVREYLNGNLNMYDFKRHYDVINDIFWNRSYGNTIPQCSQLYRVNKKLKLKGQVIGHTVQGKINSKCHNQLWRVDIGMSQAFGRPTRYQVMEILNDGSKVNILSGKPAL